MNSLTKRKQAPTRFIYSLFGTIWADAMHYSGKLIVIMVWKATTDQEFWKTMKLPHKRK